MNNANRTKKTILHSLIATSLSLSLITPLYSNSVDLSDFYKPFSIDMTMVNNEFSDNVFYPDDIMEERDLRTMMDYIDYCASLTKYETKFCYATFGKAGYKDAIQGIAEMHYNNIELINNDQDALNHLVLSAKTFGLADGFQRLSSRLKYQAPYPSFRMTYEGFMESEIVSNIENKEFLKSYYLLGLMESMNFPINPLYFETEEKSIFHIDNLNLSFELTETEIENIHNSNYSGFLSELRSGINNPTAINYLMRNLANDSFENIFNALLTESEEFPKETNYSTYALYDLAINKSNNNAIEHIINHLFKETRLNKDLDDNQKASIYQDIIKLFALQKERDYYAENRVFDIILEEASESEEALSDLINNFNLYRKHAQLIK